MGTLKTMLVRGAAALRSRPLLVAGVYGVELAFTLAFLVGAGQIFTATLGDRPLFARGVRGDDGALLLALKDEPGAVIGVLGLGMALALLYALTSLFLAGGVYESLAGEPAPTRREGARRFGAGALARFPAFARLWLWGLLAWLPALVALVIGMAVHAAGQRSYLSVGQAMSALLAALAPGLVLGALASLAVDLGRWMIIHDPTLPTRKALWRGLKLAFRRPAALAHYGLYLAAWLGVSGLYLVATWGHPFAGAGGALALFLLRQLTAAARLSLRLGAIAGQRTLVE